MKTVEFWLAEIGASKKRDKDFHKEGERIQSIYAGKKTKDTPFNILYSNTETLYPAVYSQAPIPVVMRRFRDEDPIGKYASDASQRLLKFLEDTNIEGYETFNEALQSCVLDALLPGRGVTTVKYDAEVTEEYKTGELVCLDSIEWNKVHFGYAKKWSKVPWIAFELQLDKEEAERLFPDMVSKLSFTTTKEQLEETQAYDYDESMDTGVQKTCLVYKIWDKQKKQVLFISPEYKEKELKVEDDPLELTGFYPMPKPMMFISKNDFSPKALYELYESQAKELNEISRRITTLANAIRARALYDGGLGDDLQRLLDSDEGEMVPANTASTIAYEKGLDNAIWFWPVDKLIVVFRELLTAREQCKATIYEITGISDILRGSTVASETATAQKIKSQWGSLRLKKMQAEVQRYARDLLRIMLEVAATKFSEETWAKMTGLPFISTEEATRLRQIAAIAQMTGQPLDPQTQQKLQSPVWGEVLALLKNDMQRSFRVDIETNSTVEAEATDDKEQMTEVMSAIGQALNGLTPLVTSGSLPFEAAQMMLLTIVRRYRFGSEMEDMIRAMKQPQDANGQKMQQQMQQQMQQVQGQMQQAAQQNQMLKMENDKLKAENDLIRRESKVQLDEIELKNEKQVFQMEKKYASELLAKSAENANLKVQKNANLRV